MPWQNEPLVLYHGTVGIFARDIEANKKPDLTKCRRWRDFGQGFYMTRRGDQARGFANARYNKMLAQLRRTGNGPDPHEAAVVEFMIDRNVLGGLDVLAFVFPLKDWRDLVQSCRSTAYDHKGPGVFYDAVYGPVSTTTLETAHYYEQLSFHTDAAINALQFVRVHHGTPRFQ